MKKPLTSLDLNLLLCLQLLMQERSVTKTAKRMNVTPSAVSKSLAKLRAWFDDPLFVNTPLGLTPTPLMFSMEQSLAEWMQMANQLLDKPHHETPRGLKFDLVAESPLIMILFNALSQQIYQRYPQATIKVRNWDYDSLDAIIRGEVDIGFTGRESHPRSRELLSLLPLVARPLPFDAAQQDKLLVPFTLLWHKRNSHNPKIIWLRETLKTLYLGVS